MIRVEKFAEVAIESLDDLRAWLSQNHDSGDSVWIVRYQKSVPDKFVYRLEMLDELLCWGWVDRLARKLDDTRTMQLISRRKQQTWSQTYNHRVKDLLAKGRMAAPGLAAVACSRALGLCDADAEVHFLEVPPDLRSALDAQPVAAVFFDASAPSYRRNVLRWIHSAKRAEIRMARIATTLEELARRKKLSQL